jgi:SPP1 gp7 family putative phage head morphogenesis protein
MVGSSVTETTWQQISNSLAEGIAAGEGIPKLAERIDDVYETAMGSRSELIARTEATAATNRGFEEGFQQSTVVNAKEWVATRDDRTRDEHKYDTGVGGEIVALGEKFSNGVEYPSEPNCRCTIAPVLVGE